MPFAGSADAYTSFMGRYSGPLATAFADLIGPRAGQRALDVGCGPGALTGVLAGRVGTEHVTAIDPSQAFVDAVARRWPAVGVARGSAEQLPFRDATFDLTLAQLVVHFMTDPVAGLAEMARVTRPGGTVAATVWDHSADRGPLSLFWTAVRATDAAAHDESGLAGVGEGQLAALFERAGMPGPSATALTVQVTHPTFEQWWDPFTLGVGPAGSYLARLDEPGRARLRQACQNLLPTAPFTVDATAWTVWWPAPVK